MRRSTSSTSTVATLEVRVVELEREVASLRQALRAVEARLSSAESIAGFELVDEPPSPAADQATSATSGRPAPRDQGGAQAVRCAKLLGIGNWLRNSLAGQRRGKSGRAELKERSEVYLVARSARGTVFDPVRIYTSWSEAEKVVRDQGGFKQSLFVGLPTWEDAVCCAEEAGLTVPAQPFDG